MKMIDADAFLESIEDTDWYSISAVDGPTLGAPSQEYAWYRAEDIYRAIENAPEVKPGWIPVTERLPEQGQEVIVYDGGVLKPKVYCYLFWNPNYDNWARVTHWMPLPEPPT